MSYTCYLGIEQQLCEVGTNIFQMNEVQIGQVTEPQIMTPVSSESGTSTLLSVSRGRFSFFNFLLLGFLSSSWPSQDPTGGGKGKERE